MKNRVLRIINYIMPAIVTVVTALIYGNLPDKIPAHWGFNGNVRYDGKGTIWMFVLMMVIFAFMFDFLPRIDVRKKNYEKFNSYYDGFCVFMQSFLAVMWAIIMMESFWPGRITVWKVVVLLCGLLFLFIGNMLPKVKSNFYVGIKTPWTLSDDDNWRRSNRLGGKTMFAAGAVAILAGLLLPEKAAFWVFLAALIPAAVLPCVMSYVWWRKKEKTKNRD